MRYPLLELESILTHLEERFSQAFLSLADLPDPYAFKDMQKATGRIVQAIHNQEKIAIVGDYDVDGVISTAVAKIFFDQIGYPIQTIIPNRFVDGYGLSPSVLDKIYDVDLIVTVDNGISAIEAADICTQRGIDLIITDHHIPPGTLPKAYAIVDQKQKECSFPHEEICGAQIAWYLCAALNRELNTKIDMKSYLDMVAIAIIADMMPLRHINRAMVQAGLQQFERSERPFIKAYKEAYPKRSYSAEDLAFGLAPTINSAGRLEDASMALDFVTAYDIRDARTYLGELSELNCRRKELEQQITEAAVSMVDPGSRVIVVSGEGWHEGIVGIVAARLARRFERPAIVLAKNGNICKGSGRSWRECHLYNLLSMQQNSMLGFGGHKSAIGMSIECDRLNSFISILQENAVDICEADDQIDPDIIGELPFDLIDQRLLRMLEKFEPFGQGNPKPKFITSGVTIAAVRTMGKEANHLSFTFGSGKRYMQGVQFKTTQRYQAGTKADIIYTINENHFRGETTIQLMVEKILQH